MAKRHRVAGGMGSSRRSAQGKSIGKACVEALEGRVLLAVTAGEYDTIRGSYPEFGLPADMASISIIEIAPDLLSVANLKNAITTAGSTALPDLVVLRTTDTQNSIIYASSADAISIDIPSTEGAISIVGFGSKPLTIDAANQSRVIAVGSAFSTTTANFGGLTLTGGYTTSGNGGGLYQSYGTLALRNVTISGNTGYSGGGVYEAYGTSTLTMVTISGNTTSSGGGGLYQYYGMLTLTNVTISGNRATEGGGMRQYYGTSTLTNVTISGNTTSLNGGGVYQYYGTSTLTNVTINGNASSSARGGGVYLSQGTWDVTNGTISGNMGSYGGGVYQSSGALALTNATISGNTASSLYGGGVYQSGGTLALTNVAISGNTASDNGGGAYLLDGTSALTNVTVSGNTAGGGGGVCGSGRASTWTNVTITGNMAWSGGGVLVSGILTLQNTIVAQNAADAGPDIYEITGSTLSGSNNLIGDGSGQTSLVNGVNGNLVGTGASPVDPKLAEGSDFGIAFSPVAGSPAIDAGDDSLIPAGISTDFYGAARIQGARVNIGAAETVLLGAPGTTYVVNSLADNVAADGVITLREALAAANSNKAVGDAPAGSYASADAITFAPGLSGSIHTNGQAYQITSRVSITGPGASQLALDGEGTSRVVDIPGVYDVSISGMTIMGGNAQNGGGIYAAGARLALNWVVISGNTASLYGGGAYLFLGTPILTNVTISGNTGYYGGGVYQSCGTLTTTNVTIGGNTASSSGGGVYLSDGTATLMNVTISGNAARGNGGGVYQFYGTSTLTNVTISGNTAYSGGGVDLHYGTCTLRNTIVGRNSARNSGPDVYWYTGRLSGFNNLIGDGSGQHSLVNGSNGNVVGTSASPIDPQFVNMAGIDWTTWDLHLQATSPAVNAGDNAWIPAGVTIDITGGPRITNGTVDMGAYELDQAPTVTAVYVRGSSWSTDFLSFLQANVSGSSSTYGFAIPVGSGDTQLQTLPWRNLDQISIAFSEDVSVAQAQFAIVGSVGSYSVSGFSYSASDHVATWSLSAMIGADKLYVALPGSGATPVTDTAGNALDGEWSNPTSFGQVGATSTFPSGDGVAGGDFAFRFDVLPGDSTGGSLGKVNVADINQTKSRSSLPETTSSYRSDFDANDLVNVADIAYVKTRSSISSLPVDPPVLPSFGPVFSQVSLLLRRRSWNLW